MRESIEAATAAAREAKSRADAAFEAAQKTPVQAPTVAPADMQALAARGLTEYAAALTHTSANLLCRDLWERCGFVDAGAERYRRAVSVPLAVPAHIELRVDMAEQPALSAAE